MDWSTKGQLPFNIDKCKFLDLGENNQKYTYKLGSWSNFMALELHVVEEEKVLGIKSDSQLSFSRMCLKDKLKNRVYTTQFS